MTSAVNEPGNSSARAADSGEATSDFGAKSSAAASPGSPLDAVEANFAELAAYLAHYLAARVDLIVFRLRTVLLQLVAGVCAGLVVLAAAVTATVLVLAGIANGLATVLGGRQWAGELLTGALVLIVLASTIHFGFQWLQGHWHHEVLAKYEQYRRRQRSAFGRDARQAADRARQH